MLVSRSSPLLIANVFPPPAAVKFRQAHTKSTCFTVFPSGPLHSEPLEIAIPRALIALGWQVRAPKYFHHFHAATQAHFLNTIAGQELRAGAAVRMTTSIRISPVLFSLLASEFFILCSLRKCQLSTPCNEVITLGSNARRSPAALFGHEKKT